MQIPPRRYRRRPVHQPFGGQCSAHESRPLQRLGRATLRLLEHRVADQIVVAISPVHDQVVGVEVKAHGFRKVRQPVHRSLQTHGAALLQLGIQGCHADLRAAKALLLPAHADAASQPAIDSTGRHAIAGEGQLVDPYKRQMREGQSAGQAQHHRFGQRQAGGLQQNRTDAGFAMACMPVLDGRGVHDSPGCAAQESARSVSEQPRASA